MDHEKNDRRTVSSNTAGKIAINDNKWRFILGKT
jgi:hypothetical protein